MNSPRSKVHHGEMTNIPASKLPVRERGRTISRSRSRAPPSPERSLRSKHKVDARDDANSAGTRQQSEVNMQIGHEYKTSSPGGSAFSVSKNSCSRDLGNADDNSVSFVPVSTAQVELSSSASVASSYSRVQMISPASVVSSSSKARPLMSERKPPKTYADEFLRAAFNSPGNKTRKTALDPSVPFPTHATLSHSSYMSETGRDYDDPPEITSIPTDEIVDSFTRPAADSEEDVNHNDVDETIMRGSRDQYTLGRLQARASKRRELLQQVPEEEDVTNFHLRTRASRIKHIRSLYLPLDVESMQNSTSSSAGNPAGSNQDSVVERGVVGSPNNRSINGKPDHSFSNHADVQKAVDGSNDCFVEGLKLSTETSVRSPSKISDSSVGAVGSPSNLSRKSDFSQDVLQNSILSTLGNSVCSPSIHSVNNSSDICSPIVSLHNRSVRRLSTIEKSVCASNLSANNSSAVDSLGNSVNKASVVQGFSRKSTLTSSKSGTSSSDETSEYRVKLFAKMLRLLDDVEHPGVYASSTRGSHNDERSYEYSVAELKLIQKRTEEEMSRILNQFDGLKSDKIEPGKEERLNASNHTGASIKESNRDLVFSSRSEDEKGPPPDKIMLSEAILASKLSDITSPTACQDGSGVYLDASSNNYYCVIDNNEDELTELTLRNRPPRPSSPRKKKTSSVASSVCKEGLPIVQEAPEFATECSNNNNELKDGQLNPAMDEIHKIAFEIQSMKSTESKIVPQCAADSISTDVSLNTPDNRVCEPRGSQGVLDKYVSKCSVDASDSKQSSLKSIENQVHEPEVVKRAQSSKDSSSDLIKGLDEISEGAKITMQAHKEAASITGEPGDEDTVADEMLFYSDEGNGVNKMTTASQNEARDKLLAASRSAARRTVKKQRKQAEDRFHDGIMKAVSAAEEMQRLNDEVMGEVYETFDCDESPNLNEDCEKGDELLVEPVVDAKDEELYIDATISAEQLNAPKHEQCGCVIQ
ncbi:hypothetical protein ACHAW6_014809 [Cyclotella cf. meneghiniana]